MRTTTHSIIKIRAGAGLSQRALASRLGVSRDTVRLLEQDHRRASAVEIAAYRLATRRGSSNGNGALAERFRRLEEKASWIEHELMNGYELLHEPQLSLDIPEEVAS